MFQIESFMNELDRMYQSGEIDQVEDYLLNGIRLTQEHEKEAALLMLNELVGYYRVMSRHEAGAQCAEKALLLIEQTGMRDTLNHGTTLLNIATGFRAAGNYERAEECYNKSREILEKKLTQPDFRLATLYNNMGIFYTQTGELQKAQQYTLAALHLTEQLPGREKEKAVTLTNLGNLCFQLGQPEQAGQYMKQAAEIFEKNTGRPDSHYPAAISGLAQANFEKGDLEAAARFYEQALHLIETIHGKNDDWEITKSNLDTVQDLMRRRDAVRANRKKGLELAREYYQAVGMPMLQKKYARYLDRIAVGLVGEGSECLGFDDSFSTDHDFGPGFCLWLTNEDYAEIGRQLQADYDALASEWHGFPPRNTTEEGAGRVGVFTVDDFYKHFTGYTQAPPADTLADVLAWSEIQPEMLRTAVNGEVFADPLGVFSCRRAGFAQYPEPVRLCRLAYAVSKMAQAGQYNYKRAKNRNDIGMMYNALAEFIKAASEAGYLLNCSYMPFYKWRTRGMEQFHCVKELKEILEQMMRTAPDSANMQERIEAVCALIRTELRAQKLSDTDEPFLETQKEALLRRMNEIIQSKKETERKPSMNDLFSEMSQTKKNLVEQIVKEEWRQFQNVRNEGGQADCQHNWPTFEIMRKSQFYTWDEAVLASYKNDLEQAAQSGWNLVMEKYARMMEHTAPEEYKKLEKDLPVRSERRKELQKQLAEIYVQWTREMHERYPFLTKRGRHVSASEDSEWDISSETYLLGELSTYSETTIQLYARMMVERMKREQNPVEENMNYMVHFYGYHSLQEADDRYAQEEQTAE